MPAARAIITFTSDYGLRDPFVGVCRAVVARIAPHARLIDLCHGIPRHDVVAGALTLADCAGYLPPGVHLAVVDPGVGTTREAVAVAAGDHLLVGPDNGLLVPAAERLGGARAAWALTRGAYRLEPVSATFHGRDVFAPAAAHLACGVAPDELGPPRDPAGLVRPDLPAPWRDAGRVEGVVVLVDGFGNASLNVSGDDLAAAGLRVGDRVAVAVGRRSAVATVSRTFADVAEGALAVLLDSFGRVALAVNGGDAAAALGATRGTRVSLARQ
ncbi:MAG TPA: SAM-dependent chlorinase/fluorinase [Egibacteraceae bacterium]|nr:SAM-dependent chlorinase/fluorinase [Egibacteraceae bacterium]